MNFTQKLIYNTFFQFIGKIGGVFLALVAVFFTTRYLGAQGYGQLHMALTFIQFSGVIFDLGLYLIVLQDLGTASMWSKVKTEPSKNTLPLRRGGKGGVKFEGKNDSWIISNNFTFRFFLNLIYLILIAVFYFFLPYETIVKLGIILLAFSNCFLWLNQIIITIFQKNFKTQLSALSELIGRSVLLVTTLIFIYFKLSFLFIISTVVLGFLFNFLSSWFLSRNLIKLKFILDFAYIKTVVSRTWPVAVSILFSLIYFKADSLILSFYKSAYEVGIYGLPYRILETFQQLPLLFMGLVLPLMSQAYVVDTRRYVGTRHCLAPTVSQPLSRFCRLLQHSFDALSIMTLPLIFIVLALSSKIILLIGGKEFLPSSLVLKVLIIPTGFIFLSSLFTYTIVALGQQKAMIKFYFITAVLSLLFYLIFIPVYSYWGAALGTVFAEFLVLLFAVYLVKKKSGFFPQFKVFLKALLASLAIFCIIYPIRSQSLLLTLPLSGFIYLGFLYWLKGIDKEFVKNVLKLSRR